jgi:hypothetical protein
MEVAHEAHLLQRLEVAVDRGQVYRRVAADPGRELLGRDRAVGPEQFLEHDAPGGRDPHTTLSERNCGLADIGHGQRCRGACDCHRGLFA